MNTSRFFYVFLILSVFFAASACSGKLTSSPPVSIPAPVAGLISISSPDANGVVQVRGTAGAVTGGSLVTITAGSADAALVKNSVKALTTVTVVAESDGSFEAEITAVAGDVITIKQTKNGSTSTESSYEVKSGTPTLSFAPTAAVVYQSSDVGIVGMTDGTNSSFQVYDLLTKTLLLTENVSAFAVSDLDVDQERSHVYLTDSTNSLVAIYDDAGNARGSALSLTGAKTVTASATNAIEVVGQVSSANSLTVVQDVDPAPVVLASTLLISHPTAASATHTSTFASTCVDASVSTVELGVLSLFSNSDVIFSSVTLIAVSPYHMSVSHQVNLGVGAFGDVVLNEDATRAYVTSTDTDELLILSGSGFATTTKISVGDSPDGVALDEENGFVLVANSGDNTVSVIALDSNTVTATLTTSDGIGLKPTKIATSMTLGTFMVANEFSETVSLLDY